MPILHLTRHAPSLVAVAMLVVLVSCGHPSRSDENSSQSQPRVAPISADSIQRLFESGHFDASGNVENMYSIASPPECRGLVLEVDSPLLMRGQVATASAIAPKSGDAEHAQIVEIAAVYHDDFSSTGLIAEATKTRERCQGMSITGSTLGGGNSTFQLIGQPESGSPNILLWTLSAVGKSWFCNNALIAAHNAAVEVTSCYPSPAPGMKDLAQAILRRINEQARAGA